MSISPAFPSKHQVPAGSCEQLLTQPFPDASLGLWHGNTSPCMPCPATLHCPQPLDTHFRSSILARGNEVGKVFISKNLFRGGKKRKTLTGQNLFILRCILNHRKMPRHNNKLWRATFSSTNKMHTWSPSSSNAGSLSGKAHSLSCQAS